MTVELRPLCPTCLEIVCDCPPSTRKKTKARAEGSLRQTLEELAQRTEATAQATSSLGGGTSSLGGTILEGAKLVQDVKLVQKGPGRGPNGRMRNFAAMSDDKLRSTIMALENLRGTGMWDEEAIDRAMQVLQGRGITL